MSKDKKKNKDEEWSKARSIEEQWNFEEVPEHFSQVNDRKRGDGDSCLGLFRNLIVLVVIYTYFINYFGSRFFDFDLFNFTKNTALELLGATSTKVKQERENPTYQTVNSIKFKNCENREYRNEENIKRTSEGVVQIKTSKSLGTGFVVSHARNQTLILTNSHVITGEDNALVSWSDQKNDIAYVVNDLNLKTEYKDLAVLSVNRRYGKVLGIAKNNPKVGEKVIAIGNPKGFGLSASQGMVSRISDQGRMIQTDAAFNPGVSGGPLINNKGCVVGINTSMYTKSQGLNFSISAPLIRQYLGK